MKFAAAGPALCPTLGRAAYRRSRTHEKESQRVKKKKGATKRTKSNTIDAALRLEVGKIPWRRTATATATANAWNTGDGGCGGDTGRGRGSVAAGCFFDKSPPFNTSCEGGVCKCPPA